MNAYVSKFLRAANWHILNGNASTCLDQKPDPPYTTSRIFLLQRSKIATQMKIFSRLARSSP
jgi:hypothetical protein